jgi:hypothetical protein
LTDNINEDASFQEEEEEESCNDLFIRFDEEESSSRSNNGQEGMMFQDSRGKFEKQKMDYYSAMADMFDSHGIHHNKRLH